MPKCPGCNEAKSSRHAQRCVQRYRNHLRDAIEFAEADGQQPVEPVERTDSAKPDIPQRAERKVHFGGTEVRSFEPGLPVSEEDIAVPEIGEIPDDSSEYVPSEPDQLDLPEYEDLFNSDEDEPMDDPAPTSAVERVREIRYLEELLGCHCDCLTACAACLSVDPAWKSCQLFAVASAGLSVGPSLLVVLMVSMWIVLMVTCLRLAIALSGSYQPA